MSLAQNASYIMETRKRGFKKGATNGSKER